MVFNSLLGLSRTQKILIVILTDSCLSFFATWLAFYVRTGDFIYLQGLQLKLAAGSTFLLICVFYATRIYSNIFRYFSIQAIYALIYAFFVYTLIYLVFILLIGIEGIPRTLGVIQPVILFLAIFLTRLVAANFLGLGAWWRFKNKDKTHVLVYGAGDAGRQLAASIQQSKDLSLFGFVDDNFLLHKKLVNGIMVYGPKEIANLVKNKNITNIIIAIPSASRARKYEIVESLMNLNLKVNTVPSLKELVDGKVTLNDIKELEINDLLGRENVMPVRSLLEKVVLHKKILVTGAGGSIGSELCRQILRIGPDKLLLIDSSEFALYNIYEELLECKPNCSSRIIPLLGSVQDVDRLDEILKKWRPDTIYHAAAYKHVPLVERNPIEAIKNNVYGTLNIAQISAKYNVSNFLLVSTDKAVRPTNVMGATKRIAELIVQSLQDLYPDTVYSMVRFGNVLASSGSVVPKFHRQIQKGGPITITHQDVTRYFMTISEAAELVIQASGMAKRGALYVLDMGQPIKIFDLAKRMIELAGFSVRDSNNPQGEILIDVIGLRPGEKLYEELLIGDDCRATEHPSILMSHEEYDDWSELEKSLIELKLAVDKSDRKFIRELLSKIVLEYQTTENDCDWLSFS